MSEIYSPLRYPGGKAKLAPLLKDILKTNAIGEPHYVEPYAGGAGAALCLLFEEYVSTVTINDADPRIGCFWKSVLEHADSFINMLNGIEVTINEWYKQRAIYEECNSKRVLDLGFAAFFLNRTSRSGIVHNAGPIGGYDQRGNYKLDARFNRDSLTRRISRLSSYAERISVTGEDGLSLLKRLNRCRSRAKSTFVYLDPPYYRKGPELYLNKFAHANHAALAKYLKTSKNFAWVMTYDNVEPIRLLYASLPQQSFSLSYSAYERRQGQELLIYPENLDVPPIPVGGLSAAC